ncbi:MAG: primosomal protein N' [Myxococcales bacterium]|nr:primosomal protein N' [Myxococcales bacterium]|tara:strand:- start:7693 stop:10215 length:2523 start_codon:yes stop_codon:yes gene_type:complete
MDPQQTPKNRAQNPLLLPIAVLDAGLTHPLTYLPPTDGPCPPPGSLVKVPLRQQKKMGIVLENRRLDNEQRFQLKKISETVGQKPLLLPHQLHLCRFVADYYFCSLEDALMAALPPLAPKKTLTKWRLTAQAQQAMVFEGAFGLNAKQKELLLFMQNAGGQAETQQLKKTGFPIRLLTQLQNKGLLQSRAVLQKAQAQKVTFIASLSDGQELPANRPALKRLDDWLRAQPQPVLYSQATQIVSNPKKQVEALVALNRAQIHQEHKQPLAQEHRFEEKTSVTLTEDQQMAMDAIGPKLGTHHAFLIEGITGSGKTQVYLEAMKQVMAQGKSVLFIVPEIALTPQLLARVQQAVGAEQRVVAWHSGLAPSERRDNYYWLLEQDKAVVVGARSAIFSPLNNLGLIIVDEEHDGSYKQDKSPRYHARDLALWRAKNENATILLGSATPSLESRHNVNTGKMQPLFLRSRPGHATHLPKVEVIDLKARKEHSTTQFRDRATTEGHGLAILSGPLKKSMEQNLKEGGQTLLFLNRRGYAAFVLCETCGHVSECSHCSVSLTYHRAQNALKCHQCGFSQSMITQCPECDSEAVIPLGLGTERVENEVRLHFPNAVTARLDRDVIRRPNELKKLLERMHAGEIDILIGTQMLAKGHDFPNVTLVGVILAETALAFPDFRAAERTFQLLTQVAGRAGRREKEGRVLIQTFNPKHTAITLAAEHDVETFVSNEMQVRESRDLPPFRHAALFRLEGEDEVAVDHLARRVGQTIRDFARAQFEDGDFNVLGPAPAPLERIKNKSRYHLWFWANQREERAQLLHYLKQNDAMFAALKKAEVRLVLDVDPVHVL